MFKRRTKTVPEHSASEFDGVVACEVVLAAIATGIVMIEAAASFLALLPLVQ